MLTGAKNNKLPAFALLLSAASVVSATGMIEDVPCSVIAAVFSAFKAIGPSLIGVMFLYGAAKYAYGADDPSGRKQGRTICIHAIIGGIIMGLIAVIVSIIGTTVTLCAGIGFT